MGKLSKEEIIRLYKKPNSMSDKEIYKYSGYFTSIETIRKHIGNARLSGEITKEDDEVFEERKQKAKAEREKKAEFVEKVCIEEFLKIHTYNEISAILEKKYDIAIHPSTVSIILSNATETGKISLEQKKEIQSSIRLNAAIKRRETYKNKRSNQER